MSKTQTHTPAPWGIWLESQIAPQPMEGIFQGPTICLVNKDREEFAANAHLISAAPDLLSAGRMLLDSYVKLVNCGDCGTWDPEVEPHVIAMRSAIFKAEI